MDIHGYFLCYNEEAILPHLLKHYLSFCGKVTILDNESTDSSVEIVRSFNNTDVISWNSGNQVRDDLYLELKNNVWKASRGKCDYVIVGDADEFIYHPGILHFLDDSKKNGYTLFKPEGYYMIADENYELSTSSNLLKEVTKGISGSANQKPMVFSPSIQEINFLPGCHSASPIGNVKTNYWNLKLLHYKYLGLKDFIPKQLERGKRLSEFNKKNGYGMYYLYDEDTHRKEYKTFIERRDYVI